jgi:hypothetical protein
LSGGWFHAESQTGHSGARDAEVVEEQGDQQRGAADDQVLHQRSDLPLHHVEADDDDHGLVQDIDRQDGLVGECGGELVKDLPAASWSALRTRWRGRRAY